MENNKIHCKNKEIVNINNYYNTEHWKNLTISYINSNLSKRCAHCKKELKENPIYFIHKTKIRIGNEKLTDILPLCEECFKCKDLRKLKSKKKTERFQLSNFGFNPKKINGHQKRLFLSIPAERRGVALSKYYSNRCKLYNPSSQWINNQVKKTCKWIKKQNNRY